MKALILAAGYATRLYPLTKSTPKALLPIKGITLLSHLLNKIEKIDEINEIIIITNNKFYCQFLNFSNNYKGKAITIINDLSTDSSNRLGAIGDIYLAINKLEINDNLMILASDSYFSFELLDFYNYYKNKNANCIAGQSFKTLDYKRFGIASIDKNNLITKFIEKPESPFSNIVTYAIYIYKKETLPLIKIYLIEGNNPDGLGNLTSWLYKKMPIYCYLFKGTCYDIGTLETYNKLNN